MVDSCGLEATCNQTITINDLTPPMISCLPIETDCALSDIPAYANLQAFLDDGNTVSDNCVLDSASFAMIEETTDGLNCPQLVIRKYRILDACGNESTSSLDLT